MQINTVCVKSLQMKLSEYIESVGDEKAAKLFRTKVRTVISWRLLERRPRPEQAEIIVKKSPVTYEGIYAPTEKTA